MKRLYADVDEVFHRKVVVFAGQRGLDMKKVIVEAVGKYIEPEIAEHGSRFETELNLLLFILQNGTQDHRDWITGNLRSFGEAIKLRARLDQIEQVERDRTKVEA